jgi:hypothetical protein
MTNLINDTYGIDVGIGHYDFPDGEHITRFRTMCCALGHLSINDNVSFDDIKDAVDSIKLETSLPIAAHRRDGAERAIFVVTLPNETNLEKNLEQVGFKMIYEFHRRACYSETQMLKLWIISW